MEFLVNLDWYEVIDVVSTLALLVAAATPTKNDDGPVGRAANLARTVASVFRRR